MKTTIIKLTTIGLILSLSACTSQVGQGMFSKEAGRIQISADAQGMDAFWDGVQGAITNGKASPDIETDWYSTRRSKIQARFSRFGQSARSKAQQPQSRK